MTSTIQKNKRSILEYIYNCNGHEIIIYVNGENHSTEGDKIINDFISEIRQNKVILE